MSPLSLPGKVLRPLLHHCGAVSTITALINNPPVLLLAEVLGLAGGLAMVIGHNVWSGGALPVVVTLLGWLMTIRGVGLLALPPEAVMRVYEALRYEQHFYFYMGATLILDVYLTFAGFAA